MNEQVTDVEFTEVQEPVKTESEFARKYHENQLLKRSQKKARKQLASQGYSRKESANLIKHALNRIASNKPVKKAAGRGG
jgi:hypothetical protein